MPRKISKNTGDSALGSYPGNSETKTKTLPQTSTASRFATSTQTTPPASTEKTTQALPCNTLLRRWTGPRTQELLRSPGDFGLGQVPAEKSPTATTSMICGFCATGCSLDVHLRDGKAVNISPSRHYPVNIGMACPKGWEALTPLSSPDRATTPLLRNKQGNLVPTDWNTALDVFVSRLQNIQEKHGPDSIAWLGTGQLPTEEMALLGALAKFGMGVVHGDGNTRQCMATAVVAYKQAFGFDAPPYTYADLEESDVIILVGSNLCIAHPIMWERICRNPHNPEILVIDPRATETAEAATQHYPVQPKSDMSLLYGVANILIKNGWTDKKFIKAHTTGFAEFAAHAAAFPPERVQNDTGISESALKKFATTIRDGERVSFWWTMGVNQSHQGVRTAQAIINLALITGNIGRPGTGPNSITGQCNAMGSRLFSNTTNLFGGRSFTDPAHRAEVAAILDIAPERIPDRDSLPYHRIIEGINRGKIKGLWVVATNAAHSWVNQKECRSLFDQLEFLVVQDMYTTTETAQQAHLVLPAAGWGEKEGTFINAERRIGVIKRVAHAPGQALADFYIFKLIADRWGCCDMLEKWSSPEEIFHILKELSAGQPCDITGIKDYRMLDDTGGIQWPFPSGTATPTPAENERRLFADGKFPHPDGKARLLFQNPTPLPEPTTDSRPFTLLTGRGSSSQWHTQTRTKKSTLLNKLAPTSIYAEISPTDATELDIEPNEWIIISSARGSLHARAFVTTSVQPKQIFIPMHYHETNRLTDPAFDPYSFQPAYKQGAVSVRKAEHWETRTLN